MAITLDAIKHSPAPSKTPKISLWIAQVYLAAMFGITEFVSVSRTDRPNKSALKELILKAIRVTERRTNFGLNRPKK
jgi:hypothetical protein